jgi:hypothetical protein
MSYFESESKSESYSKRKSIRIYEYNKIKFNDVVKKLGKIIQYINDESCYKKKITLFNDIYDIVLENFDIIVEQPNIHIRFLLCMFEKTIEIKSFLETEIEKGEKIQYLHKKNKKYFCIFETKYMNYIFQNLLLNVPSTSGYYDCPICLENICNNKDIIVTDCNHCFHKRCLFNHILNIENCPICRTTICMDKIG